MIGSRSFQHVFHSRKFHSLTFALLTSSMMALPCLGQQSLGQQSLGQQTLGQQNMGQQNMGQQNTGRQSLAQQSVAFDALPSAPSSSDASPAPPDNARITIPVGTQIPLVLTRDLNSNDVHTGDAVFAQVSTPVMVGDQVAIPAGTFVRGKVEKLTRNGTRGELLMQSASLVLGGEVVPLGGPIKIESEQWTAYPYPAGRAKAGIILAPIIGIAAGVGIGLATDKTHTEVINDNLPAPPPGFPPLPPLPPLTVMHNSHKGLVIGTAVGGTAGMITSFVLLAHSKGFYLEEGTPLNATLTTAISLTHAQITAAEHNAAPVQVVRRPQLGPGNNSPGGFPGTTPSNPASCTAGQEWCQGDCKDNSAFLNDNNNCGRCGNSCGIGESCFAGSCGCAAGYTSCMGSCVSDSSFISDNNNCGSCGRSCSIGESCTGGTCMKQP